MEYLDKPTKPYVPIDTCSPGGTWVEEKRYNRTRPTGELSRKVLCGNWLEERALEDDLLRLDGENQEKIDQALNEAKISGNEPQLPPRAWHASASLDIIKPKSGTGKFEGGFNCTPYIDRDSSNPTQHNVQTTYLTDYTAENGDVRKLRRPDLGVRQQLRLQKALELAAEEQKRRNLEKQAQLEASFDGMAEYRLKTKEAHPKVDRLRTEYLVDEPITLYTGNPVTGKTMVVHGKTPNDPLSKPYHGRHTYFSEAKYAL